MRMSDWSSSVLFRSRDRDAAAGVEVEGTEVHHRRGRQADVDDVAPGLAQAAREAFDQVRAGQPAVAADDNVLQPLFLHQRTDRLADQFGHAHVERLPAHAAAVVGPEEERKSVGLGKSGYVRLTLCGVRISKKKKQKEK